jgi:hypothetical protein
MVTENFPNLIKDINIKIQEIQQSPRNMNSKSPTMRHAIITFLKDKERILNVALGK